MRLNMEKQILEKELEMQDESQIKKEKLKKMKLWKKVIIILCILGIIGLSFGGVLLYGPYNGFRDWWITTAMTTMSHQYLATWIYSDDTIKEVLDRNKVEETDEITNIDLIEIPSVQEEEKEPEEIVYANEYERAVLEKDPNNDDYKIIEIEGDGYSGYLAVIYDASRIQTVTSKYVGTSGQYLTTMAKDNDALIAINGGGFDDPNFSSNGSTPLGITYSKGKLITSYNHTGTGGLIGFTEDNKLVVGKMTVKQAEAMRVRDAVTFGPFLIVNGIPSSIVGNGGWGQAPRTAIGQRRDGIVLFLVIDGRTLTRPGATIKDLIEIMQNYGAYNASNLDGGTSSVMVVDGEIINDPVDSSGAHRTRYIATGWILTKEDE